MNRCEISDPKIDDKKKILYTLVIHFSLYLLKPIEWRYIHQRDRQWRADTNRREVERRCYPQRDPMGQVDSI